MVTPGKSANPTGRSVPVASSARQGPLLRVSHTPRSIRLACNVADKRRAVKSKPRRHLGNPEAASSALVLRQPRSVEVYEEPVSSPLYMDFSGHCHAKLNDGDYLFMDQFGHAHAKLDDGGFLYMDRNGSCHNSLDDQVPVHEEHRARASHPHRRHRPALSPVMLGDLSVPPPARIERMAHDAELRKMQSKAVATSRLQQKVEGSKPSTATRRAHHIAQPRRHN